MYSDDTRSRLRQRSQPLMDTWRAMMTKIIGFGIHSEEIKSPTNPEDKTTFIIASLKGALMMSKLSGNRLYLQHTKRHVLTFIHSLTQRDK